MKALVVYHQDRKDIGTFENILKERGFDIDYIYGVDDKTPSYNPTAHDLAIVMGGPMGVYETEQHPYLLNEIKYLEERLTHDLPTLGICLGGQLMAKSLGGDVYKGKEGKETGWRDINMTSEGEKSPIHYLDSSLTKMIQGHQDTFDLPASCVLLATSDQYKNQAFSYGKNSLGLQCHPEMTEELIDDWLNKKNDFLITPTMTKEKIIADTKIYIDQLQKQTYLFFKAWLDEVGLKEEIKNA